MDREYPLHTDPIGNLANGKRTARSGTLEGDYHTLILLDPLLLALDDANMNIDRVAGIEFGYIVPVLGRFDEIDEVRCHFLSRFEVTDFGIK